MLYNVWVKFPLLERWHGYQVRAADPEHAKRVVREYTDYVYGPSERVTLAPAERSN